MALHEYDVVGWVVEQDVVCLGCAGDEDVEYGMAVFRDEAGDLTCDVCDEKLDKEE